MKILSGFEQPTSGTLLVDGRATHFNGSRQAEAAGIVLIHQAINLAEDLTIAQNIFLGREIRHAGFLDNRAMSREAAHWLAPVGLHIDPNVRVSQLIVAEKHLVEIAKALAIGREMWRERVRQYV